MTTPTAAQIAQYLQNPQASPDLSSLYSLAKSGGNLTGDQMAQLLGATRPSQNFLDNNSSLEREQYTDPSSGVSFNGGSKWMTGFADPNNPAYGMSFDQVPGSKAGTIGLVDPNDSKLNMFYNLSPDGQVTKSYHQRANFSRDGLIALASIISMGAASALGAGAEAAGGAADTSAAGDASLANNLVDSSSFAGDAPLTSIDSSIANLPEINVGTGAGADIGGGAGLDSLNLGGPSGTGQSFSDAHFGADTGIDPSYTGPGTSPDLNYSHEGLNYPTPESTANSPTNATLPDGSSPPSVDLSNTGTNPLDPLKNVSNLSNLGKLITALTGKSGSGGGGGLSGFGLGGGAVPLVPNELTNETPGMLAAPQTASQNQGAVNPFMLASTAQPQFNFNDYLPLQNIAQSLQRG